MIVRAAVRPVPPPGISVWALAALACAPAVGVGALAMWAMFARIVPGLVPLVITGVVIPVAWVGPMLEVAGLVRRRRGLLEVGGLVAALVGFALCVLGLFIAVGTQSLVVLVVVAGMFLMTLLATLAIGGVAEAWRDHEGHAISPDRARRWDEPGVGGPGTR